MTVRLLRLLLVAAFAACVLTVPARPAAAADVKLAWDANTEWDVIGYWVVWRTSTEADWSHSLDVGKTTTYTVTGLAPATSYVFCVMAYASSGLHSEASNLVTATTPAPIVNSDFDGDGMNDLLWQNRKTGELLVWRMSGLKAIDAVPLSPSSRTDLNWTVAGVKDMNADGHPDIIWYNTADGRIEVWQMNGYMMTAVVPMNPDRRVDPNWRIQSVVDMNGDGKPDLIWRNMSTGYLECWLMDGVNMVDSVYLDPNRIADSNWSIVGTFDINGDGNQDMLWFHQTQGTLIGVLMNGVKMLDSVYMDPDRLSDKSWIFAAFTDIDGDGRIDMIWQNGTTGSLVAVLLNGTKMIDSSYLSPSSQPDLNWRIVGPR